VLDDRRFATSRLAGYQEAQAAYIRDDPRLTKLLAKLNKEFLQVAFQAVIADEQVPSIREPSQDVWHRMGAA
jgi:hypothetical protein